MFDDTLARGLSEPLNDHFDIGPLKAQLNSIGRGTRLLAGVWRGLVARWRRGFGRSWRTGLSRGRHCGIGVSRFRHWTRRGILRIHMNRREPEQERREDAHSMFEKWFAHSKGDLPALAGL